MADDTKTLVALLNGIAKRSYFGENEITNEFLKSEIYPELPEEDFNNLVSKCSSLLKVKKCTTPALCKHVHLIMTHPPEVYFTATYLSSTVTKAFSRHISMLEAAFKTSQFGAHFRLVRCNFY